MLDVGYWKIIGGLACACTCLDRLILTKQRATASNTFSIEIRGLPQSAILPTDLGKVDQTMRGKLELTDIDGWI